MKKLLLSAAVLGVAALALTAKNKNTDPVVMTVDNRDVTLSEFEYLYNKNNNQQLSPLTFDEYVDMFVNYKLKVADALNAQLDTTEAFHIEFEKFRRDLAEPYLQDTTVTEKLIEEAYAHTAEDVYVSHIMMAPMAVRAVERLDSIRGLINEGKVTFEEVAREISVDKASASRGGHMGWVTGLSPYPWDFEKACYDTPVGQVSEVVNSGVGYHLILPEKRRPTRGEVKVQHILLLTRGMGEEDAAQVKTRIDSIYNVVDASNFTEMARKFSQDPGSARNGGELDWFGSGRMVAEFDSVSFALADGAISEPFATSYGYHIVHKLGHRGQRPLSEIRESIEEAIQSDSRSTMPRRVMLERIAANSNSAIAPEYEAALASIIAKHSYTVDSLMLVDMFALDVPVYTINGTVTTFDQMLSKMPNLPVHIEMDPYSLQQTVKRAVNTSFDRALIAYEMDRLEAEEPAYRNLVNEYRDGILLFDISNQKVWERATNDSEGLKNYFEANSDKYRNWTAPKYKAYVIFANNDSTLNEISNYLEANYKGQNIKEINQENFMADIKEHFGRNARVERVIAAKGENPYTDYLGFGGPKPEPKGRNWNSYMAFAAETIEQPEEMSDVKGAVVTDYQGVLEQAWLKELHNKYKVKLNKKELKKADK